MKVELVTPQGYCAGVTNAIAIAYKAKLEHPHKRICVFGMLVHNQEVINELERNNIITILNTSEESFLNNISSDDVVVFTAHGHNEIFDKIALTKGIKIYDATCPLVRKNLDTIKKELNNNHQVIYIGQDGHKETSAALSLSNDVVLFDTKKGFDTNQISDSSPLVINQTTLNFQSLQEIHSHILNLYPNARIQNEICNATRTRQEALLKIDYSTDLIVIVGDVKSSNSNKLYEIASSIYKNAKVIMVENLSQIQSIDLSEYKKATISSGASTPLSTVESIREYLLNYQR